MTDEAVVLVISVRRRGRPNIPVSNAAEKIKKFKSRDGSDYDGIVMSKVYNCFANSCGVFIWCRGSH